MGSVSPPSADLSSLDCSISTSTSLYGRASKVSTKTCSTSNSSTLFGISGFLVLFSSKYSFATSWCSMMLEFELVFSDTSLPCSSYQHPSTFTLLLPSSSIYLLSFRWNLCDWAYDATSFADLPAILYLHWTIPLQGFSL